MKELYLAYDSVYPFPTGPNANTSERKAAMKAAEQFIKEKNYSSKTQVHTHTHEHFKHTHTGDTLW